jgi:hypothetical protein
MGSLVGSRTWQMETLIGMSRRVIQTTFARGLQTGAENTGCVMMGDEDVKMRLRLNKIAILNAAGTSLNGNFPNTHIEH